LSNQPSYQTLLYDFLKYDIPVVCPACSQQAIVQSKGGIFARAAEQEIKVVCVHCGYNKQLTEKTTTTGKHAGQYVIGEPIDPFFHLPLWLTTSFENNILWAYNREHLEVLRQHIAAELRERHGQNILNKSIGSRLPKWMTAKKNREAVLKKIADLQRK
jgi:Zn ribbon nucleic-acid-binding protein